MMREQVIITPIVITKAGQIKHFQVKLPNNAKQIIGIEIGGRWLTRTKADIVEALPAAEAPMLEITTVLSEAIRFESEIRIGTFFKRNTLVGELKLQSCEEANIFYAGQLQIDNNMSLGDFSMNRFWRAKPFTHQAQAIEDVVNVDSKTTIIQGVYKDHLGLEAEKYVNYLVNVYVWYNKL